ASVWSRTSGSALIKKHDVIAIRVEETPVGLVAARTRATVDETYCNPFRVTAFLDIQLMHRIDLEPVGRVGRDRRKKFMHAKTSWYLSTPQSPHATWSDAASPEFVDEPVAADLSLTIK